MFDEALAIVAAAVSGSPRSRRCSGRCSRTVAEPEGLTPRLDAMLDQMIPELEELGDQAGLAVAFLCRAQVGWMNCRYTDAKDECDRALTSAQGAGDVQWMLKATTTRVSWPSGVRPPSLRSRPSSTRCRPKHRRRIPPSDHSPWGHEAW